MIFITLDIQVAHFVNIKNFTNIFLQNPLPKSIDKGLLQPGAEKKHVLPANNYLKIKCDMLKLCHLVQQYKL